MQANHYFNRFLSLPRFLLSRKIHLVSDKIDTFNNICPEHYNFPGFFLQKLSRGKLINHKRFQFHQFEYSRQTNSAAADAWYFVLICRENKKHPCFEKNHQSRLQFLIFGLHFVRHTQFQSQDVVFRRLFRE